MDCPNCELALQINIAENGQVFLKCAICGYEESSPDLEPPPWNSKESYEEVE